MRQCNGAEPACCDGASLRRGRAGPRACVGMGVAMQQQEEKRVCKLQHSRPSSWAHRCPCAGLAPAGAGPHCLSQRTCHALPPAGALATGPACHCHSTDCTRAAPFDHCLHRVWGVGMGACAAALAACWNQWVDVLHIGGPTTTPVVLRTTSAQEKAVSRPKMSSMCCFTCFVSSEMPEPSCATALERGG